MILRTATKFQSTPLREGRLDQFLFHHQLLLFQSTPLREGRRGLAVGRDGKTIVSIHAPA